jgi:hypothetical protein
VICLVLSFVELTFIAGCGNEAETQDNSLDILRSLPYTGGTPVSPECPTGVTMIDTDMVCSGYRLYTLPQLGSAVLIDVNGISINSWHVSGDEYWGRAVLTEQGDLLVIGRSPRGNPQQGIADSNRFIQRLDWSGRLLWNSHITAHHDVDILPDGRLVVLGFRRRLVPEISTTTAIRDDCIFLMQPDGSVIDDTLYFFSSFDGSFSGYINRNIQSSTLGGTPWIDLFHANSVQWIQQERDVLNGSSFENAYVLVCFRHQDRIALFDWNDREVVWSWGGSEEIIGPHDASLLENGNILLFDNGLGRKWSRAIEINPYTDQIEWEYISDPPESFYTASKGSAQRLPNGNTLLCESDNGRAFEISPDGELVWEYICPYMLDDGSRSAFVRMTWYPSEMIEPLLNR